MKHTFFLLLICGALCLCACRMSAPKPSGTAETTDPAGADASGSVTDEDSRLREAVITLMKESADQQDPGSLFSDFAGDYEISGISTGIYGERVRSIKRKGAVSYVSADGVNYYGVEAAGNVFYAADRDGKSKVVEHFTAQEVPAGMSTIFVPFGIDTGVLTGGMEDERIDLTPQMLTVSADKQTVTFSRQYIDELAKQICEGLGYNDAQTAAFLRDYKGSGVYAAATNTVTFELERKDAALGNIRQVTRYSVGKNRTVNAYSLMEYSNPALGITTPLRTELDYRDVVYRDGAPVSATIQVKTTTDVSFYDGYAQDAVYISATQTIDTTFVLDCTNAARPKAAATSVQLLTEAYRGESSTYKTVLRLSVDPGSSGTKLDFTEQRDGDTVTTLKATGLTFATPSAFPTVPGRVTSCITAYIEKEM